MGAVKPVPKTKAGTSNSSKTKPDVSNGFANQFLNWFSSFDAGQLVRRRSPKRHAKDPAVRKQASKSKGLRFRVPIADQVRYCEAIYGPLCILPGGVERTLDLVQPFRLTKGMNFLDLNAGLGAAALALKHKFQCNLTLREPESAVAKIAQSRMGQLPYVERISIDHYATDDLQLQAKHYDAILIREMMYRIPDKENFLGRARSALRMGGQIIITDLIRNDSLESESQNMTLWHEAEPAAASPLTTTEYRSLLQGLNLEIHNFEDDSLQYAQLVRTGWAKYVKAVIAAEEANEDDPDTDAYQKLICEAEYWHSRIRAIESGDLKLVRIRAIRHSSKFVNNDGEEEEEAPEETPNEGETGA